MKRLILTLALAALCVLTTSAQKTIPYATSLAKQAKAPRAEIILPQVKGYTCYKGDFHVHTTYSDGKVSPAGRVIEAWLDGLDIVAITDHYEHHLGVKNVIKSISMTDSTVINYRAAKVSHNKIHEEAVAQLEKSGFPMLLVKGGEITRGAENVGHFNMLFLQDIDAAFDADPAEAFRKAKAQGGIVIHNHPAWRRKTCDKTEFHQQVYAEGLVDGVEVVNGYAFYPPIASRCIDEKLAMFANTDEHYLTEQRYGAVDRFRTMTLVLASDFTEEAVKEAILDRRTIAFSGGSLIGEEMWLGEFLNAAVDCRLVKTTEEARMFRLTNNCSITMTLIKGRPYILEPFKSILINVGRDKESGEYLPPIFEVENMWHVDYQHPKIELTVDK
jgi:predicted metal-dependent phosphoesterase TrpH